MVHSGDLNLPGEHSVGAQTVHWHGGGLKVKQQVRMCVDVCSCADKTNRLHRTTQTVTYLKRLDLYIIHTLFSCFITNLFSVSSNNVQKIWTLHKRLKITTEQHYWIIKYKTAEMLNQTWWGKFPSLTPSANVRQRGWTRAFCCWCPLLPLRPPAPGSVCLDLSSEL